MPSTPQPVPVRQYPAVDGQPAVGDYYNTDQNTLFACLQGGLGVAHFATNAGLTGNLFASNTIPFSALLATAWTDYSSTITVTGFTGALTTKIALSQQIGKTIITQINLSGTSNAVSVTFTVNIPALANQTIFPFKVSDNGVALNTFGYGDLVSTSGIVTCFTSPNGGAWTNSGLKQIQGTFIYQEA